MNDSFQLLQCISLTVVCTSIHDPTLSITVFCNQRKTSSLRSIAAAFVIQNRHLFKCSNN